MRTSQHKLRCVPLFMSIIVVHRCEASQEIVSIPATGNYRGSDGLWSTIQVEVGTPPQEVEVLVSTASAQIWVVQDDGCNIESERASCVVARGGTFIPEQSMTWSNVSDPPFFDLYYGEYIGYGGNAQYGFDTVSLGSGQSSQVTIQNTTLGALAVFNFFTGFLGLEPGVTNFTSFEDSAPCPLQLLQQQHVIGSYSYGFNPGAFYRNATQSLTLGGYNRAFVDQSSTISYNMQTEALRDLTVNLQTITTDVSTARLLPTPIAMGIDSTVSQIYLPIEACREFELVFDLEYDEKYRLYLVNDTKRAELMRLNASVTLSFTGGVGFSDVLDVNIPYSAFDLYASPSFNNLSTGSYYFPINRAEDTDQYVLGRTFLQEVYLLADYERNNFSMSAMKWSIKEADDLVAIFPKSHDTAPFGGNKTVMGIVIACSALGGFLFVAGGTFGYRWRLRRSLQMVRQKTKTIDQLAVGDNSRPETTLDLYSKPELEAPLDPTQNSDSHATDSPVSRAHIQELAADLVNTASHVEFAYEMEGDMPHPVELEQGGELTEKEKAIMREKIYNGIDPGAHEGSHTARVSWREAIRLRPL